MSVKILITDDVFQVTKINSDGTTTEELVWETPEGLPADGHKGDQLVNTGAGWVQVPVGTDGQVLKANSSAAADAASIWENGSANTWVVGYDSGDNTHASASAHAALAAILPAMP